MNKKGKPCEFAIIPCDIKKGSSICRHNRNTLNVFISSTTIIKRLLKEYTQLFKVFHIGDTEGGILFDEIHMLEAAKILKARTKGKMF